MNHPVELDNYPTWMNSIYLKRRIILRVRNATYFMLIMLRREKG